MQGETTQARRLQLAVYALHAVAPGARALSPLLGCLEILLAAIAFRVHLPEEGLLLHVASRCLLVRVLKPSLYRLRSSGTSVSKMEAGQTPKLRVCDLLHARQSMTDLKKSSLAACACMLLLQTTPCNLPVLVCASPRLRHISVALAVPAPHRTRSLQHPVPVQSLPLARPPG